MIDREKVIKGLIELHGSEETMTVISDAIALLKEQEPVSVAGPNSYEEYWDREAICPDCGTHWMSYDKNGKRVTKYCPGCGRPVKWE